MAAADTKIDAKLPTVSVPIAVSRPDFATILGLLLSFGLIIGAIAMGQSDAQFFNLPSVLIVILGTITATCTSYTGAELAQSGGIIARAAVRPVRNFPALAKSMMDLATIARKKGLLFLSNYEKETKKEPFLKHAMGIVIDGYSENDVRRILQQDIDLEEERQKRAASILRRASEVAPAMGLIGTLVGLVQMLANLENPDTIGPAMAVALLTTFYGAILGSIVMSPLAAKIEKNADDEVTAKTMVLRTAMSIIKQENPRNLEMLINALLPPSQRIRYFD
ncbi:MAG: biopolymer transporter ExbB [Alphaproteobacteria bacterium]|nr:MAG: biopolymer transporter ExbB [Alphaproteobacteria bacterium]